MLMSTINKIHFFITHINSIFYNHIFSSLDISSEKMKSKTNIYKRSIIIIKISRYLISIMKLKKF